MTTPATEISPQPPRAEQIVREVCASFGISPRWILPNPGEAARAVIRLSNGNVLKLNLIRGEIVHWLREELGYSYPACAAAMGSPSHSAAIGAHRAYLRSLPATGDKA